MATTGILTPEQLEILRYPYAYFEVTTNNNGSYHYPKVCEDDIEVTFLIEKPIENDECVYSYFIVTKETGAWVYGEQSSSVALDDYLLKLDDDEKVTVDLIALDTELDGTFIRSSEVASKLENKVPTSRKINNKALTTDITLLYTDIANSVPVSRKVNTLNLTQDRDITVSGGVLKT